MSDPIADENRRLHAQLAELLQHAAHNESIWQRHQAFDLQLIAAASLRELLDHLFRTLPAMSSLDVVTLTLLDPNYDIRRVLAELEIAQSDYPQLLFAHTQSELGLVQHRRHPLLDSYAEGVHGRFFPEPLPTPASIALAPLMRNGCTNGCLAMGSADAQRFEAGMSTDFLLHMASLVAVCLENVINRERLQRLGLIDALTGVHNRRYVERRLLEETERARRNNLPLSCLFIDIDHFKQINDRWGHAVGDLVLREVAARIKAELRLSDALGRYGGEEFVTILTDIEVEDACRVAERIRCAVGEQPVLLENDVTVNVSVSLGVAAASRLREAESAADGVRALLERADRALYQAKSGGRNRVFSG